MLDFLPNWTTTYQEGIDAVQSGNFQLAIDCFSRCIEIDDKNPILFIQRSNAYYVLKQYEKALSDIYSSLAIDQSIPDAYATKGMIEWAMGNLQSAINDYDKALLIDPNNSIYFMNRGQVKRDIGDLDGALADSARAIELDPDNSIASQVLMFCETMKSYPDIYKGFIKKKAN